MKSASFQLKWKKYKRLFGKELDTIFGNDYDKKIMLANGLDYLSKKLYSDAYYEIRRLVNCCTNEADTDFINKLIKISYNEKEMSKVKVGDWVKKSSGGYYKVLKKNDNDVIIKYAFDFQMLYMKESKRSSQFYIELTDLKTFQFVGKKELKQINKYFKLYPKKEEDFLRYTDKMLLFRKKILENGFKDATGSLDRFNFYYIVSEKVAFIINLNDLGDCIKITYGFTSISDYNFLQYSGEPNDWIKIRFQDFYKENGDEQEIINNITNVYNTFCDKTKDEILALKKIKQKEFLNKIYERLKPLNFKKKNTTWTRPLEDNYCLKFKAQKSQWSDVYYFYVIIEKIDVQIWCYYTQFERTYDWQVLADDEFNELMDFAINDVITPIINTPLNVLGKQKQIYSSHCMCSKTKCENCWIKK